MTELPLPPLHEWLVEPFQGEVKEAIGRLRRAADVQHVAVMPDVHLAAEVCVGVAVATSHLIYPQAVGGDIGCGILAVPFDVGAECLADSAVAQRLLAAISRAVPARRWNRRAMPPLEIADLPDAANPEPPRFVVREAAHLVGAGHRQGLPALAVEGPHVVVAHVDEAIAAAERAMVGAGGAELPGPKHPEQRGAGRRIVPRGARGRDGQTERGDGEDAAEAGAKAEVGGANHPSSVHVYQLCGKRLPAGWQAAG